MKIFSLTILSALASCGISNILLPLLATTSERVLDFGVIVGLAVGIRGLILWFILSHCTLMYWGVDGGGWHFVAQCSTK